MERRPRLLGRLAESGHSVVLLLYAFYFGGLALFMSLANWRTAWQRFGVATSWKRPFLDTRSLTSAWECTRRGVDVLAQNPCDPLHRPFNYPRVWMRLTFLGLGQGSTLVLGAVAVLAGVVAVPLIAKGMTAEQGVVLGLVALSPAVMLGFERGNTDLVIFAIVALAVYAIDSTRTSNRIAGQASLGLACLLKLYPVFAAATLVRRARSAWIAAAVLGVGFLGYMLLTFRDVRLINAGTPREVDFSYGAAVGPAQLVGHEGSLSFLIAVAGVLAAIVVSVRVTQRTPPSGLPDPSDTAKLDLFCAGAAIFVGTFLLAHNFEYRLVFLTLTVPQLVAWASSTDPKALLARRTLAAMIVYLWLKNTSLKLIIPLELLDWVLFVYFLAALQMTAPFVRLPRVMRRRFLPLDPT